MPTPAPREYLHKATFETLAAIVTPSESERQVATASLQPLRALLPTSAVPEQSEGMLYLAANGAVAGLVNRNGDAITCETALRIYRTALHRYLNLEHDRDTMVGCIINAGLSDFETNEPLSEKAALAAGKPFNLSIAGALWTTLMPQLARYLVKVGPAQDQDALSLSWEIAFDDFVIAVGSRDLSKAKIVGKDDPQWEMLEKCLARKGGTGKSPDGQEVFRVIAGDAVILGYSIVANPAAHVKGILPITESAPVATEQPAAAAAETLNTERSTLSAQVDCISTLNTNTFSTTEVLNRLAAINETFRITAKDLNEGLSRVMATARETQVSFAELAAATKASPSEKIITHAETRVTPNIAPMKIENIEQLKTKWADLRKEESAASVEAFVASFEQANQKYLADLNTATDAKTAAERAQAAAEQAKATAETKAAELQASIDQAKQEIAQLKQAALAAEKNAKFVERMAALDEVFELDEKDLELLAADVRACADDAAFAAFVKKQEKLMCSKKKGAKAAAATTTTTVTADTITTALASVTPVAGQVTVPAGQVTVDTSVADEMDAAFGSTMTVAGKTVAQHRAAKVKAEQEAAK